MTNVARMMQLADEKAAAAKGPKSAKKKRQKDKPRKGGDGGTVQAKAPEPPPAGADREELVRLIFPAPPSLSKQIDAYWHKHGLKSKSAAIRVLLEKGLAK